MDTQTAIAVARQYTLVELGVFIGVVCTSVTSVVVAIITAWRTGAKVDTTNQKLDLTNNKVDQVHLLTNSTATRQKDEIQALVTEVKALTAHIAQQEQDRAVLAAEKRAEPRVVVVNDHESVKP